LDEISEGFMTHRKRKVYFWSGLLLAGAALLLALVPAGLAQELLEQSLSRPTRITSIELGPHPEKTRILIHLDRETEYRVLPDFAHNKIGVFFRNATLHPRVRDRVVKDVHLSKIQAEQKESVVKITLHFKSANTHFIHKFNNKPPQIVVDLAQGKPGAMKKLTQAETARLKKKTPKKPRVKGKTQGTIEKEVRDSEENKLKWGWKEYTTALDLFQQRNYPAAIPALQKYVDSYTRSPFRINAAYLIGEAEWKIAIQKPEPNFEQAIAAYRFAIREHRREYKEKYPKRGDPWGVPFFDHAVYKLAVIYDDLNYVLEAKSLYEEGLVNQPRSRYNEARKIGLARMMLKEGRLEEAHNAFKLILKKKPNEIKAREGMYQIAVGYYRANDFKKALEVFEDAVQRWPEVLGQDPSLNYTIAEIYYSQEKYEKARQFFFNLVNLDPESLQSHKSLNQIGDSYLIENNGLAAYAVFNRSQKIDQDGPLSLYAQIRLADIGIRYPGLKIPDLIYDNPAYFKPYETYDKIFEMTSARNIRAEVILSRGTAYFQEQRFLQSIEEFKRLMDRDKKSRFYRAAKNSIRLAMVHLVDQYSTQGGSLPILYAYNNFIGLNLGDVENVKTLLQIGEAYKGIGMNAEALRFFEQVKLKDTQDKYNDRLFLNLGEIHLAQKHFKEAELVSKTFINNYTRSPEIPRAMMLLAAAYKGQKLLNKAIETYENVTQRPDVNPAEAHYQLGDIWFASNDLERATGSYRNVIDNYDRGIKDPPDYIQAAYFKLGIVYHMLKRNSESLSILESGRKLFPDHELREWGDFLIADNLEELSQNDRAFAELKDMTKEDNTGNLVLQAAETRMKVLDWEKRLKDRL